jgi:sulfite oxidase
MAQRTAGKHPKPEGLQWAEGTIANCVWAGAKLRDVLLHAGVPLRPDAGQEDLHVRFASHVTPCEQDGWYGGSIPLDKAMDESEKGDVLLAYEVRRACL